MKSSEVPSFLAVAVILLVIGTALGSIAFPVPKIEATTKTSTVTTTTTSEITEVSRVISIVTGSTRTVTATSQSLVIPCSNIYPNGTAPPDVSSMSLLQNATAYLCVRYYYYNSTADQTIKTSNVIQPAGYRSFNSSYFGGFDPSANFTINAYPRELTLGGPSNENEGAFVFYTIHSGINSSGTYLLNILATLYPSMEDCASFTKIIVGTGIPDYHVFGSCTAPFTEHYPLNSQGFINGFLFAQVVGMSNSSS